MLRMKTITEIRYRNLEQLVMDAAKPGNDIGKGLTKIVAMATANGKKLSRPVLYQILTKKETAAGTVRNVGNELARKIEDALRLDSGWMDSPKESFAANEMETGIRVEILSELIFLLDKMPEDKQKMLLGSAHNLLGVSTAEGSDAARNKSK